MKTRTVFLSTLLFSLILILAGCTTNPTPCYSNRGPTGLDHCHC